MPLRRGYDGDGPDQTVGGEPVSILRSSPLTILPACFAGYRGSIRRKYVLEQPGDTQAKFTCTMTNGGSNYSDTITSTATTDLPTLVKFLSSRTDRNTGPGTAMTTIMQNPVLEVNLPFYSNQRFRLTRRLGMERNDTDTHEVEILRSNALPGSLFTSYVASGEDFCLFFFTGVPPLWQYQLTENT